MNSEIYEKINRKNLELNWQEVINKIVNFIYKDSEKEYELTKKQLTKNHSNTIEKEFKELFINLDKLSDKEKKVKMLFNLAHKHYHELLSESSIKNGLTFTEDSELIKYFKSQIYSKNFMSLIRDSANYLMMLSGSSKFEQKKALAIFPPPNSGYLHCVEGTQRRIRNAMLELLSPFDSLLHNAVKNAHILTLEALLEKVKPRVYAGNHIHLPSALLYILGVDAKKLEGGYSSLLQSCLIDGVLKEDKFPFSAYTPLLKGYSIKNIINDVAELLGAIEYNKVELTQGGYDYNSLFKEPISKIKSLGFKKIEDFCYVSSEYDDKTDEFITSIKPSLSKIVNSLFISFNFGDLSHNESKRKLSLNLFYQVKGKYDLLKFIPRKEGVKMNVNSFFHEDSGNTLLHVEVMKENVEGVKRLIYKEGASLYKVNKKGMSPYDILLKKVKKNSSNVEEIMEIFSKKILDKLTYDIHQKNTDEAISSINKLEELKGEINTFNKYGYTSLQYAVKCEHFAVVEYLVEEKKANLSQKNRDGETVFSIADDLGNKQISDFLSLKRDSVKTSTMSTI